MPETAIVCAKCAAPSDGGLVCPKCGGGMAKVCGQCQFKNSVQKKYCDRCGGDISSGGASAGGGEIPQTVVRRGTAPQAQGLSLPPAGRSQQSYTPVPPPTGDQPRPTPTQIRAPLLPRGIGYLLKSALSLLFLAGLGLSGLALWKHHQRSQEPGVLVPALAQRYLWALSRSDYAGAYQLLSPGARASCGLDEFRRLRDSTPWTWSDLALVKVEPDSVLMEYALSVSGKPPEKDYLFFTLEDGQWVRPYNWHLIQKIEQAFEKNDPDMALIHANEAVRLNPRDPMARGYLCEALYYRKVAEQLERECELAVQLLQVYPSRLSAKSLFHLRAILGDAYKNSSRKYPQAVEQYTALLEFPNLSAGDRCDLTLARADSLLSLAKPVEALSDLERAGGLCSKPADLDYIRRKKAELGQRAR